ncbi:MAG: C1 family peptidase [Lentimicrobium sp.]|nr:C1 family peptidase [Lentimicrobium sp.]
MRKLFYSGLLIAIAATPTIVNGQDSLAIAEKKFRFDVKYEIPVTPVKNQNRSGTCWSFAAVSFVESELLRLGEGEKDLSEMFYVNLAYRDKAQRYIRYHGNSNFGPGGQAHDVINAIKKYEFVTEDEYPGIIPGETSHNHGELNTVLKSFLSALLTPGSGKISQAWFNAYQGILDAYMGPLPLDSKTKKNREKSSKFNPEDYLEITSYLHHPFYSWINLEIPDNWSQDKYFNIPIDEMMSVIFTAIEKGYTICWDGDVSDKGFSHANGLAILPEKDLLSMDTMERERWELLTEKDKNAELYNFEVPGHEKKVTQEMRQVAFDSHLSTDDHLMHLTGIMEDQNGTRYLLTKNSWAANSNKFGGFLKMSEAYVRMNTIAIMVHKDALPDSISKRMKN